MFTYMKYSLLCFFSKFKRIWLLEFRLNDSVLCASVSVNNADDRHRHNSVTEHIVFNKYTVLQSASFTTNRWMHGEFVRVTSCAKRFHTSACKSFSVCNPYRKKSKVFFQASLNRLQNSSRASGFFIYNHSFSSFVCGYNLTAPLENKEKLKVIFELVVFELAIFILLFLLLLRSLLLRSCHCYC